MVSTRQLQEDIIHLTQTIGVRLAGSTEERLSAEYMKTRFLQHTPHCWIEEFPVMQRCVEQQKLEILVDGNWKEFPVCLYNLSPSTNDETVEAELVIFEGPSDSQRPDLSYLTGKAVLHYGSFSSEEHYRRVIEAKPAFLLMVDVRYTSHACIANGLGPASVERYGSVPTAGVAFFDAWKICTHESTRARLTIVGGLKPSVSQNVIAELPGSDPDSKILYCGAHLDSVADSPGADDNAASCAILLELARILAKKPHRHTIRLIAFGAEEQLSVGSAAYVRSHRQEVEQKGRFMCNFDSCCSIAGWFFFVLNVDRPLKELQAHCYHKNEIYFEETLVPDPYNDLFAFTAAGVPGITHMRKNCSIGRFYHHQSINTADVISTKIAGRLVEASSALLEELANRDDLEVCRVHPDVVDQVASIWENTYGGWG